MLAARAMAMGAMRFRFLAALPTCALFAVGCSGAGASAGVAALLDASADGAAPGVVGATLFEADSMKGHMCSGILSAAKGAPSSPSEKCTRLQYPAYACVS